MGTNYYLKSAACPHCGRRDSDELHIGKSSAGWSFSFHGYDKSWETEVTIRSCKDWREFLEKKTKDGSHEIVDEYGRSEPLEKFWNFVEAKRKGESNHTTYVRQNHPGEYHTSQCWLDDDGCSFNGGDFS